MIKCHCKNLRSFSGRIYDIINKNSRITYGWKIHLVFSKIHLSNYVGLLVSIVSIWLIIPYFIQALTFSFPMLI
jgi:hypothetical protein